LKNALVRRLGAPIENLLVDIDERYINQCGEKLMEDILDGKNPSDGEDAIKAAFENHAERFAEEYANAFASIDGLNIPVSVKDWMKIHVLANLGTPQLHPIYVQALVSAVRELGRDDQPDAVLALFAAGTQAGDMFREALGQFEGELDTTTLKAFAIGVLQRQ
jgi:hypothetical protein